MRKPTTLTESKTYYINKIRHHDKHGAYIPMDVLLDIRTKTHWQEISKAVFAVINTENSYLLTGWDCHDFDENDIVIHKIE